MITRLNIGGPARQELPATRELVPWFRTTLVAGTPADREGELLDAEVPVVRIPLVRPLSPRDDVRAYRQLGRLLAADAPRIVHTNLAKAGAIGRVAAGRLHPRPRTVHTYHGHVHEGYFARPVQAAFVEIERRLARRTDVLLAVSTYVRDELVELGIGRPDQYRVMPLGLELDEHLRVAGRTGALRGALDIPDDVPLVAAIGRLVPIKDVGTLIRAVARVPGAHLALLGDGECREELRGLADDLGIGDRVHLTGWWLDVPAALADVDLIALSSLNEGTPVALIEAAACGIPAVATSVGGVPDVVEDGRTGLLMPPRDPVALSEAIERLLADDGLRRTMGEAARERARRWELHRLVRDLRALYHELLETSP